MLCLCRARSSFAGSRRSAHARNPIDRAALDACVRFHAAEARRAVRTTLARPLPECPGSQKATYPYQFRASALDATPRGPYAPRVFRAASRLLWIALR
jgi:hypothetical protein